MPRLRSSRSGVVVNVDDGTAAGLDEEWVAVSDDPDDPDEPEGPEDDAPKGNASRDEWAAYADSLGVEYPEDAKRDDIKAAVEAASTED